MSVLYKLTRDITGAVSSALGFTDEQQILYFNDAPPPLVAREEHIKRQNISNQIMVSKGLENIQGQYQAIYAPTAYGNYVMEVLAVPVAPYLAGINSIVAQIRYYPDPSGEQRGYCIYNGKTIYKRVVCGAYFIINLPRNSTQPIIDPACNIYFNFYNL